MLKLVNCRHMLESTSIIVSAINLFSLVLGCLAIGLAFKLIRTYKFPFLNYYLLFVVCAVITGFCDWIIFNLILLLIPDVSMALSDSIFHIFWDLLGFPSAILTLFFLVASLNSLLNVHMSRELKVSAILLAVFVSLLSYFSFYLRFTQTLNFLNSIMWSLYTLVIPIITLVYLVFALRLSVKEAREGKAQKNKMQNSKSQKQFILFLIAGMSVWYCLSLVAIHQSTWRHLIIGFYYLAILLPTIYLYSTLRLESSVRTPVCDDAEKLMRIVEAFNLTAREKELAAVLIDGKSNQEISDELYISLQTVKNYVSKLYKKVGIKNRIEFVNFVRKY